MKRKLTGEQKTAFFQRSYTAADGLWFMKVEEKHGFEEALATDNEVWKVVPKIQARMLKNFLGRRSGIRSLRECLRAKLHLEGFAFSMRTTGDGFSAVITRCPWYDAMVSSGRRHLAERVHDLICATEYSVWATEFGPTIRFSRTARLCAGDPRCVLTFRQKKQ